MHNKLINHLLNTHFAFQRVVSQSILQIFLLMKVWILALSLLAFILFQYQDITRLS